MQGFSPKFRGGLPQVHRRGAARERAKFLVFQGGIAGFMLRCSMGLRGLKGAISGAAPQGLARARHS